ncbi:hypothetical protein [Nocardia abscessus]|uniref:hypothetical protein n=1 Tax=Nocardia abscessus TaxID=120957 RepID=UPI00245453D3|nr:hypothetical protein [Nocardia abscessus]
MTVPPPHIERTAAQVVALWHEVRQLLALLDLTLPDIVDIATTRDPAAELAARINALPDGYDVPETTRRFRRIAELARAAGRETNTPTTL